MHEECAINKTFLQFLSFNVGRFTCNIIAIYPNELKKIIFLN